MTLVAGFRCMSGGILLCADREYNDGFSKRSVDKVYRVRREQGSIFIASAGNSVATILRLNETIESEISEHADFEADHLNLLGGAFEAIYTSNPESDWPRPIMAVCFNRPGATPMMYKTEAHRILAEPAYASEGSGKFIADYLADRLYRPGLLNKISLGTLGAFILREAGESTSGVGLGADMVFIHDRDREFHYLGADKVRELQSGIPKLGDAVWPYWVQNLKVPKWLEGK